MVLGLDEQPGREGGTWLGLSSLGKIGILLNVLGNSPPDFRKKGRGKFEVLCFMFEKAEVSD